MTDEIRKKAESEAENAELKRKVAELEKKLQYTKSAMNQDEHERYEVISGQAKRIAELEKENSELKDPHSLGRIAQDYVNVGDLEKIIEVLEGALLILKNDVDCLHKHNIPISGLSVFKAENALSQVKQMREE